MKNRFGRTQLLLYFSVFVTAGLLYFGGYYLYISPLDTQEDQLKNQLGIQEQVIAKAADKEKAIPAGSSMEMQKQLPVVKATDQMVVTINLLGNQANSTINTLTMVDSKEEVIETTEEKNPVPEGVATVTYHLEATTDSYQQMHTFLEGLKNMDRLINMELLQFGKGEGEKESFDFSVSFKAYYDPELSSLASEGPEEKFTQPAEKKSPFKN